MLEFVKKFNKICKSLNYKFKDLSLLKLALTHSSYSAEQEANNQRLEFLGDSILNFIVAGYLYNSIQDATEGELTRIRSFLVQGSTLKLIAEHLEELIATAKENNVSFLYEAAVGGSIPIIRNLEEYYNNDSLSSVQGIVNGTTNYILTQSNHGVAYEEALAKAQELGFAEIDPTLDVDGFDSKYKLVLLIKHAFGLVVEPKDVFNYGIRNIKPQDVKYAGEKGYRIKLFSRAEKLGNDNVVIVTGKQIGRAHV